MNRFLLPVVNRLPPGILSVAVAVQLGVLVSVSIAPVVGRLWAVRSEPARARSASLSFGASFSSYIDFLVDIIPDDALVVIPPFSHDRVFGHTGLMQYFLFPRSLTNCPRIDDWDSCKIHYDGDHTYLISVEGFPPLGEGMESKKHIAFDNSRGVFVPANSIP